MAKTRLKRLEALRAKVALEAVKGARTLSELSVAFRVYPTVIAHWKRQLVDGVAGVFGPAGGPLARSEKELTPPLYEEIGRLKMEVD